MGIVRMLRGYMRSGNLLDVILVGVLIFLCVVLLARRNGGRRVTNEVTSLSGVQEGDVIQHVVRSAEVVQPSWNAHSDADEENRSTKKSRIDQKQVQKLIDERIQNIPDVRSAECRSTVYNTKTSVSIIIAFFDYQFFDLKTTIASIFEKTEKELINEIILIDDGSTLDYIKEDADLLVEQNEPLIKMHRLEERAGVSNARMIGSHHAESDVIVFLDTNTVVNEGWLEPLVKVVISNRNAVAVPHYDSVNDPVTYHYTATDSAQVNTITWQLAHNIVSSPEYTDDTVETIFSPAFRTNAFAVHVEFLSAFGNFFAMKDLQAEMLEMSLRTWLCGGSILVVPCSRVGVLNLYDNPKPVNTASIKFLLQSWMEPYKDLFCDAMDMDCSDEDDLLREHRQFVSSMSLKCSAFYQYVENVVPWLPWPDPASTNFGLLKVNTGRCAKLADDTRLELTSCRPNATTRYYPKTMLFETRASRHLKVNGKCVQKMKNSYITGRRCSGIQEDHLRWTLASNGRLNSDVEDICAMHVTDPDPLYDGRQIIMAQKCHALTAEEDKFVKWEIVRS